MGLRPLGSYGPGLGALKMLFIFIDAEGLDVPDMPEEDTLRKGVSGRRRLELCAGLMGCEDAPGRARPAASFCSEGIVSRPPGSALAGLNRCSPSVQPSRAEINCRTWNFFGSVRSSARKCMK